MKKTLKDPHPSRLEDQRGVTIILVAILMFVFLGVAALAIDLSTLYVAGNELQNAADAGALAGTRFLYTNSGALVNTGANQIACQAARDNLALSVGGAIAVEVNWGDGECNGGDNTGDVQRGHWSFGYGALARGFYPNDTTDPVNLWGVTSAELDGNVNFINAVRVMARREAAPVASFFARIFGHESFELSKEAVAYIGFAGSQEPFTIDMPIAICAQALGNPYDCTVGRFINSGGNLSTSESGGWTDLESCGAGGANRQTIRQAVDSGCTGGGANQDSIVFGTGIAMNNGQVQTEFTNLRNCWVAATDQKRPWLLRLPVIDCSDGGSGGIKINTCNPVIGVVEVRVLWITEAGQGQVTAPEEMEGWGDEETGNLVVSWEAGENMNQTDRWNSFVEHFSLENLDRNPAPLSKKTIYFAPDCTPHEPSGDTGGENFGILAEIPKLVL